MDNSSKAFLLHLLEKNPSAFSESWLKLAEVFVFAFCWWFVASGIHLFIYLNRSWAFRFPFKFYQAWCLNMTVDTSFSSPTLGEFHC